VATCTEVIIWDDLSRVPGTAISTGSNTHIVILDVCLQLVENYSNFSLHLP